MLVSAKGRVEHQKRSQTATLQRPVGFVFGVLLDYSCRLKRVPSDGENPVDRLDTLQLMKAGVVRTRDGELKKEILELKIETCKQTPQIQYLLHQAGALSCRLIMPPTKQLSLRQTQTVS